MRTLNITIVALFITVLAFAQSQNEKKNAFKAIQTVNNLYHLEGAATQVEPAAFIKQFALQNGFTVNESINLTAVAEAYKGLKKGNVEALMTVVRNEVSNFVVAQTAEVINSNNLISLDCAKRIEAARVAKLETIVADDNLLFEAIMNANLSLLDPFTKYYAATEANNYSKSFSQNAFTVDINLEMNDSKVVLAANKANIEAGAELVFVGITQDLNLQNRMAGFQQLNDVKRVLAGNPKNDVILSFRTAKGLESILVKRNKEVIEGNKVTANIQKDNNALIAMPRLYDGNENTSSADLIEAIKSVDAAEALILDLRDNQGGSLTQALEILSVFIADEHLFSTTDKNGQAVKYNSVEGSFNTNLPLTVLVNRNTTSSAELIAGVLQSFGRATIVGEQTFGKGTSQMVVDLEKVSGKAQLGMLKTTNKKLVLANGVTYHGVGIVPDQSTASL